MARVQAGELNPQEQENTDWHPRKRLEHPRGSTRGPVGEMGLASRERANGNTRAIGSGSHALSAITWGQSLPALTFNGALPVYFRRGSRTSRRLSPRMLNPNTVVTMLKPGNTAIHHARRMNS